MYILSTTWPSSLLSGWQIWFRRVEPPMGKTFNPAWGYAFETKTLKLKGWGGTQYIMAVWEDDIALPRYQYHALSVWNVAQKSFSRHILIRNLFLCALVRSDDYPHENHHCSRETFLSKKRICTTKQLKSNHRKHQVRVRHFHPTSGQTVALQKTGLKALLSNFWSIAALPQTIQSSPLLRILFTTIYWL